MEQQPLKPSVLKATRNRSDAHFNATTLMMTINQAYCKAKGKDVDYCKMREIEMGFELTIPMKVNGEWKRCPVFRWTKSTIGARVDYDPRVITL